MAAIKGLGNYYNSVDEEIDPDITKKMDDAIDRSNDRSFVFTCLEFQINAGLISEFSAMCQMDDWKHRGRR
jgi:hypothetical protein